MSEIVNWRDGDIYFWSWKHLPEHMPYHCCACKAVVRNGLLTDTFWGSDNRRWTREEAAAKLTLEYKGNFDQLEELSKQNIEYYDPADIVDMRHSNSMSAKIFHRKGSERSKERILHWIQYKRERALSEIQSAQSVLERLKKEEEAKILAGGNLNEVYL